MLVNNAGTAIPKTFEETTLEEMDRVIDINLRGTFVATQAALKHMKDGGRIIMIGSSVGERMMTPGLVPYSATKGAVKMFTQGDESISKRGLEEPRRYSFDRLAPSWNTILSPKLTVSTSGFGRSTRCSGGAFSYDPTAPSPIFTSSCRSASTGRTSISIV